MNDSFPADATSAPIIDRVGPEHTAMLADIFSDSFDADPVMNWIIPETQLYPGFYRMMIDQLFGQHNHMYMDREQRGASLWLPPGVHFNLPMSAAQIVLMLRLVFKRGFSVLKRLENVQQVTGQYHPDFPHYYLQSLGARVANQGQGVGSALLKATLPRCDSQQVPAYLESSNERNVPLYERHGFEVIGEEALADGGPTMWFMLRQPQDPKSH